MNDNFGLGIFTALQFFWWDVTASPVRTYNKLRAWRDRVLSTVEYLQNESAKWRALFTTLKLPYSALRMMGVSPNMAVSLLIGGSVATTGVVAAEVMQPPSFEAGDPGIYALPNSIPIFHDPEKFNTLRVDLAGISVGNITIEDLNLGTSYTGSTLPQGETHEILIGGKPTVVDPAFTGTHLIAGHVIVDRWRCLTLTLKNIEANKLIIRGNQADGLSFAPIPGTPIMRGIGGGNRADDHFTSGGTFDQLKILAATSGVNSEIDVLHLTNLYAKGSCVLDRMKIGTLEVILNTIGGDTNLSTKAFVVEDTVVYKSLENIENVEVSMAAPVIQ
tara:strand:+ start:1097 stop:2092 length:996 start_codon:yes stop_codon:yes gene_type:complete